VSIDVAPPNAIGAYWSILTVNEIVVIVSSSLRKLTVKPNAPNSAPNSWPTKGPANVYQPKPALTAIEAKTLMPKINPPTNPPKMLPKATANGTTRIFKPAFFSLSVASLSTPNETPSQTIIKQAKN